MCFITMLLHPPILTIETIDTDQVHHTFIEGTVIVCLQLDDYQNRNKLIFYHGSIHELYSVIHEYGTVPPCISYPSYELDFAEKRDLWNTTQWLALDTFRETLLQNLQWIFVLNICLLVTHINTPHTIYFSFDYYNITDDLCEYLEKYNGDAEPEIKTCLEDTCRALLKQSDILSFETPENVEDSLVKSNIYKGHPFYIFTYGVKNEDWNKLIRFRDVCDE